MFVDAHSHWSDVRVPQTQISALLKKSLDQKISLFLLGGVSPQEWTRQQELKKEYPEHFLTCFGLHPYFVSDHDQETCEKALDELAFKMPSAVALGETGLDFREKILSQNGKLSEDHFAEQIAKQIEFFENQIQLANSFKKPLVLHSVRALEKTFEVLDLWGPVNQGGIAHAFNSSYEIAKRYLDLGLKPSIGGAVTYPKNQKLREALTKLDLGDFVIESDSPDQPPLGWEGPNDSSSLWQIAKEIGDLKAVSAERILEATTRNFKMLFNL